MQDTVDDFLEHLELERGLSENTLRAYGSDLERFGRFLEEWRGESVDLETIDAAAIRAHRGLAGAREGRSAPSQGRALSAIRTFFRFAVERGVLKYNPASGVPTPKTPKKLPRHLRPGEIEALLAAPGSRDDVMALRDRAILELLYAAGLRVSELVSLDWNDLDLSARTLRVIGKGGKETDGAFRSSLPRRPCAVWLATWRRDSCCGAPRATPRTTATSATIRYS